MNKPLVSVICLCYNHARFIEEALLSVINQTYQPIEIIVVDDGSTDTSVAVMHRFKEYYNNPIVFIENEQNVGMCRSFNKALHAAKGTFIIDLAADDRMVERKIEVLVDAFEKLPNDYGVVYSDALLINEKGENISTFYKRTKQGALQEEVPVGFVFKKLLSSYKICSPTMMVRKSVFDTLGGYDENLSYEDYDFFVRSSRIVRYFYVDKLLTEKREVKGSDSSSWYKKGNNPHLTSTLVVCKKALWLCQDSEEKMALLYSVRYHFRQSYFLAGFELANEYYLLMNTIGKIRWVDRVLFFLVQKKVNVYFCYIGYLKFRKFIN